MSRLLQRNLCYCILCRERCSWHLAITPVSLVPFVVYILLELLQNYRNTRHVTSYLAIGREADSGEDRRGGSSNGRAPWSWIVVALGRLRRPFICFGGTIEGTCCDEIHQKHMYRSDLTCRVFIVSPKDARNKHAYVEKEGSLKIDQSPLPPFRQKIARFCQLASWASS